MWLGRRMVLVAGLCSILTGCADFEFASMAQEKEDFRFERPLQPGGRLSVENMNGSVEITAWEKDTVEVVGTKFARSQDLLKQLQIDVVATPDAVRIRTVPPGGLHGNYGAKYVIRVPARTELERIATSNGQLRVEGITGPARLKTSNGSVRVSRLQGSLDVTTSNGRVEVRELAGPAVVHTSNGAVDVEEVQGSLDITTSNGRITARLTKPEPQRPVRLESSNGSVELTMNELNDNPVRVRTSNSSVTMRLPASVNAQLSANTSNSNISSDFDVTTRGTLNKHHLEGTIGRGGPLLSVSTSNGSIRLQKL